MADAEAEKQQAQDEYEGAEDEYEDGDAAEEDAAMDDDVSFATHRRVVAGAATPARPCPRGRRAACHPCCAMGRRIDGGAPPPAPHCRTWRP